LKLVISGVFEDVSERQESWGMGTEAVRGACSR
jgi:hypothetical protein